MSQSTDITQIYVIITGAILGLVLIICVTIFLLEFGWLCIVFLVKHFFYPLILWQHCFFRLWSHAQVILHLLYMIMNTFCSTFRVSSIKELDNCTGTLSLINMISSYLNYHLSFISDILDLSLITYCCIHASADAMSVVLSLFHAVINVADIINLNLFRASGQLFKFIVSKVALSIVRDIETDMFFETIVSMSILILQLLYLF